MPYIIFDVLEFVSSFLFGNNNSNYLIITVMNIDNIVK